MRVARMAEIQRCVVVSANFSTLAGDRADANGAYRLAFSTPALMKRPSSCIIRLADLQPISDRKHGLDRVKAPAKGRLPRVSG